MKLLLLLLPPALVLASLPHAHAQISDSKRVTMTMNADGSKTVYESDPGAAKTTATTTDAKGKLRAKILYTLDPAGRFVTGEVLGPDGTLRFTTSYKYDALGKLEEEKQTSKGALVGRIVYHYDSAGRQIGYSTYDGAGKLLGRTGPVINAPPKKAPR